MALALLRLEDGDDDQHTLVLDTGTSTHYRLHLGKEVRREEGFELLDAPYWSSPLRVNPRAGRHVDTRVRCTLDAALVTEPGTLVQLETCRGPDGRGPAWSAPVRLPGGHLRGRLPAGGLGGRLHDDRREVLTMASASSLPAAADALAAPRTAPLRSAAETWSRPASIADLIGSVVQAAAPIVLDLLNRPGSATGQSSRTDPTAGLLTDVLRQVLAAMVQHPTAQAAAAPAAPAPAAAAPAAAAPLPAAVPAGAPAGAPVAGTDAATALARPSSLDEPNRFVPYVRPMVFGIDDALIASLAGPVLSNIAGPLIQMLPQLMNAANQQKLARQALTNQQVSDLLSQVDRTLLMQQLISARSMPINPGVPGSGGNDADLAALQALLQSTATAPAPTGTPATAPTGAAVSQPASLPVDEAARTRPTPIASKAVLSAVTGPPITRLGRPCLVFVRDQAPTLRFRLDVGAGGPATPRPRAILQLCVREPGGAHDLVRREERLTGLAPGAEVKVALTADESAALPTDTDLEVLACLRWRGGRGTYQATASSSIVIASRTHVRDRGDLIGAPVELTDMHRFRSFWNQVWSSPTQAPAADSPAEALPLWGLDVALRYSVVLTGADRGNGLMQARLRQAPVEQGLRAQTTGRLKSGLEISVAELNKLLPLWPGESPLSTDDLAAFTANGWLAAQGGDAVTQVRLEGKRGTRGQLWVVPVLKLRTFTLAEAVDVDPYGQVVTTRDRTVHFPVVESIRVLGLASLRDADEPGEAAEVGSADAPASYRFDGYDVVLDNLVGLDPARPLPRRAGGRRG